MPEGPLPLTWPGAFVCHPCRQGRHLQCDMWRGCECAVLNRLDDTGLIVVCPAIFARIRRNRA